MEIKIKTGGLWLALVVLTALWGCGGGASKDGASADGNVGADAAVGEAIDEGDGDGASNPDSKADYKEFIPEGYELLDTAFGDLNLDAHEDAIMVLRSKDEVAIEDYESLPRPVMILTGTADHRWVLEGRNDNAALGAYDGGVFGDPWDGITIKNGYFSLEHYGGSSWRWTRIITFKYDPAKKGWFLHKDGGDEYNTSEPENVTSHVSTTKDFGVVGFADFRVNGPE